MRESNIHFMLQKTVEFALPDCSIAFFILAVTCPPLVLRIVSFTNVTPSTVINVTCPKGHQFNLVRSTTIETVCDPSGNWIPVVPDCIGNDARVSDKLTY